MIDPIAALSSVAPSARLEAFQTIAAVTPGTVSAADRLRFQAALQAPGEAAGAPSSPPASGSGATLSMGDSILRSFDRMRVGYSELTDRMQALSLKNSVSPQELLSMQMQMTQVSLEMQLVTQVVSKIEQDLGNLLKSS
jgi:type III secretion system YscI/HrpB-like protein